MSSESGSNNPNANRIPALLLLAVAAFGPPSVATLTFAHAVTQNPWLTALLIALYEVIVFVLSFAGKVWQKLESPLVDTIAEWLLHWGQGVVSSTERNYCQHIIYEHRVFDVKGLSTQTAHALELEQVFVEVCVDPKAPHQTSANPIAGTVPEILSLPVFWAEDPRTVKYKIWDYFAPKSGFNRHRVLTGAPSGGKTTLLKSIVLSEDLHTGKHEIWDYLAPKSGFNRHLVIIGAPGSGKTTLLKHIALALVQRHHKQLRKKHGTRIPHLLPILLFLRDHVKSLNENPAFSLVDAIQAHAQREWQQTVSSEWITQRLANGLCLVLLDGLDEVADPVVRRRMVEWVEHQMRAYGLNRFLLTSRPHGYRDNPIEGVTVMEVRPFTPEQVEQFVYNWYRANELKSWGQDDPGVRMSARKGAQDLLQRLHHAPALLELAVNPLLLTMIATVHRYRSSLPGKRVALYAEICEVFLGKRQEARGVVQELTPAQKQQVLQPLAYHLMQQGTRDISLTEASEVITPSLTLVSDTMQPKDFLEMIQNTSGVLLERDPGVYSFAHLTFQEYLAAVHIKETGLEELLVAQVGATWWHETIRLYCAQADATNLILACLAGDRPSVSALTLALECEQEALKLQVSARAQVKALLDTGVEDPDLARRRLIAEALLMRRVRQMVHLHDNVYIDTSLVTCAEYQVFLDEQRAKGKFCHPDHWDTYSFSAGQGHDPILGIRSSDAIDYCQWLTAREDGRWRYRLPSRDEVVNLKMNKDIEVQLVGEVGYWLETNDGVDWGGEPLSLVNKGDIEAMISNLDVLDHNVFSKITLSFIQARMDDLVWVIDSTINHTDPHQSLVDIQKQRLDARHAIRQTISQIQVFLHATEQTIKPVDALKKASVRLRDLATTLQRTEQQIEFAAEELRKGLGRVEQHTYTLRNSLMQVKDQEVGDSLHILKVLDQVRNEALTGRDFFRTMYQQLQTMTISELHQCELARRQVLEQLELLDYQEVDEQIVKQFDLLKHYLTAFSVLVSQSELDYNKFYSDFIYDVERAQSRALALERAFKLVDSLDHVSPLDAVGRIVSDRDFILDLDRALDRALALDFSSDPKLEFPLSDATILGLGRADQDKQGNASFMQLAKEKSDHQNQEIILLSRLIRYVVLYFIGNLKSWSNYVQEKRKIWIFSKKRDIPQNENTNEDTIRKYLDVYRAFALLELRIEGKFPAREGILLVKERVRENINGNSVNKVIRHK